MIQLLVSAKKYNKSLNRIFERGQGQAFFDVVAAVLFAIDLEALVDPSIDCLVRPVDGPVVDRLVFAPVLPLGLFEAGVGDAVDPFDEVASDTAADFGEVQLELTQIGPRLASE